MTTVATENWEHAVVYIFCPWRENAGWWRPCCCGCPEFLSRLHRGVQLRDRAAVWRSETRHTDVGFHAEVPVGVLLRLVHVGVALAALVFGRRRRRDQRRVGNRPFTHHQTFLGEGSIESVEDLTGPFLRLDEQVAKFGQRGDVRRLFPT